MTVRDTLRRESRQLSAIIAVVVVAMVIIPVMVWWVGFPRLAGLTFFVLLGTFASVDVYRRHVALCCPRCGKSLGPTVLGANWFTPLDQLDRCPTCNLDLDRELESIQTI
jgi:hypothetical protein